MRRRVAAHLEAVGTLIGSIEKRIKMPASLERGEPAGPASGFSGRIERRRRTRRYFDQGATSRPGYYSGLFVVRGVDCLRVLITIGVV